MKWNRCYNMVMEIKKAYEKNYKEGTLNIEHWVETLYKDLENTILEADYMIEFTEVTKEGHKFTMFVEFIDLADIIRYKDFLDPLQFNHAGDFVLIRYGLAEMQRGMWTDPESVYRHCRSTVIDLKNEKLILHPYTKFFNLNEVDETRLEVIQEKLKVAKIIEIANKLDGSLFSARYYKDKIFTSTSMALLEENSWRLADANRMLQESKELTEMIQNYPEYTFVFEYISIKDTHVVIYKEDDEGLYLIGITDMRDGRELNYREIIEIAKEYDIKSTIIENISFDELLTDSKTIQASEKEGWVINIDGQRFKIKGDDYVSLHRLLDSISSVNVIIEAIAEDTYDDLISKVPFAYRGRVEKIANEIFEWKIKMDRNTQLYFEMAPKGSRKEFMYWVDAFLDTKYRDSVKSIYLGKEYNLLKGLSGNYKSAREIFGMTAEELMGISE